MPAPLLELNHIQKRFGQNYALRGVSFQLFVGECVALVGENGAGKSTLMKILSGVWPTGTFEGEYLFEGKPVKLQNTLEARKMGISIIHQELCLYPHLSVSENLFISEEAPYRGAPSQKMFGRVDWKQMHARAQELMQDLGFDIDVRAKVISLSVAQRQLVEIARAFHHQSKVLVLDEPTSALSNSEVDQLFNVIRRMQSEMSFVYISHKLEEVFALSHRIVVLRDGQSVAELKTAQTSADEVIKHMVGREVHERERESFCTSKVVLSARNLNHIDSDGRLLVDSVSFVLHEGEVLGIAGLMGSGRSELLRSMLGVLPGERSGELEYLGRPVKWDSMAQAMEDGVAFLPEDRKKDGLFLEHGVDFNMTLAVLEKFGPGYAIDLEQEKDFVRDFGKKMLVKYGASEDPVRTLSGGNQQKVLLAKVMANSPKVLLLDEPTRGIDIGAKEEIYGLIRNFAKNGLAVVVVSSELPEILALADTVMVLRDGQQGAIFPNQQLTQEMIMNSAAGGNNVHAGA